jgi:hypothetical protein
MIRDTAATRAAPQAPLPGPGLHGPGPHGPADAARAAEPRQPPPAPLLPNPRIRIDTELSLVVLEFRDDGAEVSRTIPSPREIDAYRAGAEEMPGAPREAGVDVTR